MLKVEEKDRITWEELFAHKAIPPLSGESLTTIEVVEDLNLKNFLLESSDFSDKQMQEIQEFGRR
jgi:hypothetical protein